MTYPTERRPLAAALRTLFARLRPGRRKITVDQDPEDWGDDPTGAWSPDPTRTTE
ncbi:hypothetical protein [Kitasatospora sp. NPDC004272]